MAPFLDDEHEAQATPVVPASAEPSTAPAVPAAPDAPAQAKARIKSFTQTWVLDGTQHPSLRNQPLTLTGGEVVEVDLDQVEFLTTLPGVSLVSE